MEYLKGKKTYIVAIVGIIVNGAYAMGYVSEEWVKAIDGALLFLGLGTIRAGIAKGR